MDLPEKKQMMEEEAQPRETPTSNESNHESDNKSEEGSEQSDSSIYSTTEAEYGSEDEVPNYIDDDSMGSENSFDQAAGAEGPYMEQTTSSSADDLSETSEKAPSVYSSEAHDENKLDEENSESSDSSDNSFCPTAGPPATFAPFHPFPSLEDDLNNLQFTEEEYQEFLWLAEPF